MFKNKKTLIFPLIIILVLILVFIKRNEYEDTNANTDIREQITVGVSDKPANKNVLNRSKVLPLNRSDKTDQLETSNETLICKMNTSIPDELLVKLIKKKDGVFVGVPGIESKSYQSEAAMFFNALTLGGRFFGQRRPINLKKSAEILEKLSNAYPDNLAYALFFYSVKSESGLSLVEKKDCIKKILNAKTYDAHFSRTGRELYQKAKSLKAKLEAHLIMNNTPFPDLASVIEKLRMDSDLSDDEKTKLFLHLGSSLVNQAESAEYPSFVWGYHDFEYNFGSMLIADNSSEKLKTFKELDMQKDTFVESELFYQELESIYKSRCEK